MTLPIYFFLVTLHFWEKWDWNKWLEASAFSHAKLQEYIYIYVGDGAESVTKH